MHRSLLAQTPGDKCVVLWCGVCVCARVSRNTAIAEIQVTGLPKAHPRFVVLRSLQAGQSQTQNGPPLRHRHSQTNSLQ